MPGAVVFNAGCNEHMVLEHNNPETMVSKRLKLFFNLLTAF